jgi:hypothetical protein
MNRVFLSCLAILILMALAGCPRKPQQWPAIPAIASPSPNEEFNLVWSETDLNGLPHNPLWGLQQNSHTEPPAATPDECIREPYQPACTVETVLVDRPGFPSNLLCVPFVPESHVHGHVDWMPSEVTGLGAWLNFADDWDYNLMLFPTDDSGAEISNGFTLKNNTSGASQYMEIEFASEETADSFVTPWWSHFRSVVRTLDSRAIEHELYPANDETLPRTVVVGLFGLDCEHDCRSELHPVYAMAVEVSDDPSDNTWAVFVRNWGTGGFCSSLNDEMQLPNGTLQLLLPRKSHGTVAVDRQNTQFASIGPVPFPDVAQIAGKGTVLTFHLPDAGRRPLAEMFLHLNWTNDDVNARPKLAEMTFSKMLATIPQQKEKEDAESIEGYLGSLMHAKTQSRLSVAPRSASLAPTPKAKIQAVPQAKIRQYAPSTSKKRAQLPSVKTREDATKSARDRAKILAVCDAYNSNPPTDKIPNFPEICKQVRAAP